MRKELPYFKIENSYGGNQSWFRNPFMNLGGCAAATACDSSIYLAMYEVKARMYPYDIHRLSRKDYIQFSKKMKPYLHPRLKGINTLKLFINGFQRYIKDVGETNIKLSELSGELSVEEAKSAIRMQIDKGRPIPYLLLKHKNPNMRYFTWHWFLLVGYEESETEFYVKTATYGKFHWFSLPELWNTRYKEKGGMIILD